jgi:hypothetical protein
MLVRAGRPPALAVSVVFSQKGAGSRSNARVTSDRSTIDPSDALDVATRDIPTSQRFWLAKDTIRVRENATWIFRLARGATFCDDVVFRMFQWVDRLCVSARAAFGRIDVFHD